MIVVKQKTKVLIGVLTGLLVGFVFGSAFGSPQTESSASKKTCGDAAYIARIGFGRTLVKEQGAADMNGAVDTGMTVAAQEPADTTDGKLQFNATDGQGNNWEIIITKQ